MAVTISPFALIGNLAFRRVWVSGALSNVNRWLEILAVGVWVYDRSGSAFDVTLMFMLRMLPLMLFGALAGSLAERFDRRALVMAGLCTLTASSTALGLLAAFGDLMLWHVAAGAFLNGMVWACEMPLRRTMLGDLAGDGRVAQAMGFDTATNNATRMLGPVVGGGLLEGIGISGAFFAGAILNLLSLLLMVRVHIESGRAGAASAGVFTILRDGFRYIRANRPLVATLVVTVIYNIWGFPMTSMVPVIGKEELGLSAFPVGVLQSAEGLGALLGALGIAWFGRAARFRRIYVVGVAVYMASAIVFAASPWFLLSGTILVAAGIGGACFSTMQSTLTFLGASPEMRNRAMGVLTICIGTGPIGFLHLGLLAEWLGAHTAVIVIAIEGLVMLALALLLWPEARQ
ncbi:MAG: MFS transporter [Alphaproteobacteria bacterium]|nr:MFS transporter [Alphaproteobacteria bacterium]MCY4319531.1 MFS transporter [Alphaproteobacteria bacterium]